MENMDNTINTTIPDEAITQAALNVYKLITVALECPTAVVVITSRDGYMNISIQGGEI